jgi:hypothetical protein
MQWCRPKVNVVFFCCILCPLRRNGKFLDTAPTPEDGEIAGFISSEILRFSEILTFYFSQI